MLVFIELDTRIIHVAGVTANPVAPWVTQQARNLAFNLSERTTPLKFLIWDRDAKFPRSFDQVFQAEGVRVVKTPVRAPRANAICERVIGTIRRECLDRMLILGRRHLEAVLAEYAAHYNDHRPHRSLSQRCPNSSETADPVTVVEMDPRRLRRANHLSGLIHEYRMVA